MVSTYDWPGYRLIISLICNGKYLTVINDHKSFVEFTESLKEHIGDDITHLLFLSTVDCTMADVEALRDLGVITFTTGEV